MPKNDYLTGFLSKNMYNDVLGINGTNVTALNVFYHFNVCTTLEYDREVTPLKFYEN